MRYVIPFYDRFFWFLPDGLLKLLRCGFDYSEVCIIVLKMHSNEAILFFL